MDTQHFASLTKRESINNNCGHELIDYACKLFTGKLVHVRASVNIECVR